MLPAMIFLILCILQLTLLQQARVMTEYAAFNAARAGIVHNMNNGTTAGAYGTDSRQRRCATRRSIRSSPTYGRTDLMAAIATTRLATYEADRHRHARGRHPDDQGRGPQPRPRPWISATYGAQLNGQEIDFDDMRPKWPRPSTLLSIQVRYLFEIASAVCKQDAPGDVVRLGGRAARNSGPVPT